MPQKLEVGRFGSEGIPKFLILLRYGGSGVWLAAAPAEQVGSVFRHARLYCGNSFGPQVMLGRHQRFTPESFDSVKGGIRLAFSLEVGELQVGDVLGIDGAVQTEQQPCSHD